LQKIPRGFVTQHFSRIDGDSGWLRWRILRTASYLACDTPHANSWKRSGKQKRRLGVERGCSHYARLSDEQLTDTFHYTVFPNFATSLNPDGMLFLRALPHASDPEQCLFDCWYYTFGEANSFGQLLTAEGAEGKGQAARQVVDYGATSLGVVLDGDAFVMAAQQRAMRSRGYRGSVLAGQEKRVAQYHERIDQLMHNHAR
jgi:Ring hydroxylating alpha subunit (catalytic domain)